MSTNEDLSSDNPSQNTSHTKITLTTQVNKLCNLKKMKLFAQK
jgi:hypothetical protein